MQENSVNPDIRLEGIRGRDDARNSRFSKVRKRLGLKQKRRDPDSGTRGKQKPERKIDSERRYQFGCKMTASRVDPR